MPEAGAASDPASASTAAAWDEAASLVADMWLSLPDGEEQIVAACAEAVRSGDDELVARWERLIDLAEPLYEERLDKRNKSLARRR